MNNVNQFEQEINKAAELIKRSKIHCGLNRSGNFYTIRNSPIFVLQARAYGPKDDPLEVASLSTFKYNPEKFYDWLLPLAQQIRNAKPNLAHKALADLEKHNYVKAHHHSKYR